MEGRDYTQLGSLLYPDEYVGDFSYKTIKYYKDINSSMRFFLMGKRIFDFTIACVGIIILFIPFLVTMLLIRIESKGPVIIKQKRIGQYAKPFYIYKFRTMYQFAPDYVPASFYRDSDFYFSKVGKFIRKTSMDELPQLFNVLKGEMSLIGFRPVIAKELKLNTIRQEYGVFACKPGITGWAQINGRDDLLYKEKAMYDRFYLNNRSVALDLYIMFKTIPVTISQRGMI